MTTQPNPTRTCIGCTQTDDHPRHVVATPDGGQVTWHMDCHALATDCEVCKAQTEGVEGKTGEDLREHLVTTSPEPGKPGWTDPNWTV